MSNQRMKRNYSQSTNITSTVDVQTSDSSDIDVESFIEESIIPTRPKRRCTLAASRHELYHNYHRTHAKPSPKLSPVSYGSTKGLKQHPGAHVTTARTRSTTLASNIKTDESSDVLVISGKNCDCTTNFCSNQIAISCLW